MFITHDFMDKISYGSTIIPSYSILPFYDPKYVISSLTPPLFLMFILKVMLSKKGLCTGSPSLNLHVLPWFSHGLPTSWLLNCSRSKLPATSMEKMMIDTFCVAVSAISGGKLQVIPICKPEIDSPQMAYYPCINH